MYRSCRHVHTSQGDGEYSIDPTMSGNPFTVYCDMTTDGGNLKRLNRAYFHVIKWQVFFSAFFLTFKIWTFVFCS